MSGSQASAHGAWPEIQRGDAPLIVSFPHIGTELPADIELYEAHSIRSHIPRLFEGLLPHFNIGTNSGASCAPELTAAVEAVCDHSGFTHITNGRFKGGWITRHYGDPAQGVHAIQIDIACRGYMAEPAEPLTAHNWPSPHHITQAAAMREALMAVMHACLAFVNEFSGRPQ